MLQETITRDRPAKSWRDYVVPQCWESFTADDHAVWDLLFARQVELLGSRVVSAFLDGIDLLKLSHPGVPDVDGLNAILLISAIVLFAGAVLGVALVRTRDFVTSGQQPEQPARSAA